jgi:membrane protease subunit (stomatin/prohibitin family)
MIKKKRSISPEVQAKGAAALAEWRTAKAYATKKGGKFLEVWLEDQALKKAQKNTSPVQAIKNFCNECVGGMKADITNCTAKKCPIYIYRPYQKDEE